MLVQFGNVAPRENGEPMDRDAPCVTYVNLHEMEFEAPDTLGGLKTRLLDALSRSDGITHEENEAVLSMVHPGGIVSTHSGSAPSWVWSDDEAFGAFLGDYYDCPVGIPEDVEDTHHTMAGPPGVIPMGDVSMQITQNGRDLVARQMGGGLVGASGVSTTAPGATAYTLDGVSAPGSTSAYTGQRIIAGSSAVGSVWANIISNTNASPPVLTVDRWYNAATPGGAAATTPLAGPWMITDGGAPAWFVGLSASAGAPGSAPNTNTSLPGEITSGGGGLIRKIAPWAHTASAQTWTLTPVYTANGSDSLPVTIASYGVFCTLIVGDTTANMLYYNTISPTATLSSSGDQLTLTITATTT